MGGALQTSHIELSVSVGRIWLLIHPFEISLDCIPAQLACALDGACGRRRLDIIGLYLMRVISSRSYCDHCCENLHTSGAFIANQNLGAYLDLGNACIATDVLLTANALKFVCGLSMVNSMSPNLRSRWY